MLIRRDSVWSQFRRSTNKKGRTQMRTCHIKMMNRNDGLYIRIRQHLPSERDDDQMNGMRARGTLVNSPLSHLAVADNNTTQFFEGTRNRIENRAQLSNDPPLLIARINSNDRSIDSREVQMPRVVPASCLRTRIINAAREHKYRAEV